MSRSKARRRRSPEAKGSPKGPQGGVKKAKSPSTKRSQNGSKRLPPQGKKGMAGGKFKQKRKQRQFQQRAAREEEMRQREEPEGILNETTVSDEEKKTVAPEVIVLDSDEDNELPLPLYDDATASSDKAEVEEAGSKRSEGVGSIQRHASSMPPAEELAGVSGSLSTDIHAFVRCARNSEEAEKEVKMILKHVSDAAGAIFGASAKTCLFGSRATGLSLPCGDLDIGILNLSCLDIKQAGAGFQRRDRTKASSMLTKLLSKLRKMKLVKRAQVIRARVPIIKCQMGRSQWNCDISLGVSNGDRACALIKEYMKQLPHFTELVLVIKAVLMSNNLNEVYTGGLGSYSLYNMVIAHLLVSRKGAKEEESEETAVGSLLITFMQRFGYGFDYESQAVSINKGGFVKKRPGWKDPEKPYLIAIEDPQEAGRDIGAVSYNIRRVRQCFAWCYDTLRKQSEKEDQKNQESLREKDGEMPFLAQIMHVTNALRQKPQSLGAKMQSSNGGGSRHAARKDVAEGPKKGAKAAKKRNGDLRKTLQRRITKVEQSPNQWFKKKDKGLAARYVAFVEEAIGTASERAEFTGAPTFEEFVKTPAKYLEGNGGRKNKNKNKKPVKAKAQKRKPNPNKSPPASRKARRQGKK